MSITSYPIDTAAGAVIISDIGSSEIAGNDQGGFSLRYHRYFRIHILKSDGYKAAQIAVRLYKSKESKEEIRDIVAVTYNMENGRVQETKLDTKKEVFTESEDKNHLLVKFAFPAVKAGSIVECKYTIKSDFIFNLQPWTFQGQFPCLWSEYNAEIPQFYNYVSLTQGKQEYFIKSAKEAIKNFAISETSESNYWEHRPDRITISASVSRFRWVMKDVPALVEENYTSSLHNHYSRIEFQLSETRSPLVQRTVMSTWPQVAKELFQHEKFGAELLLDNTWLIDQVNKIAPKNDAEPERARKIFNYVRDHMACTGSEGLFLSQTLRSALKKGNGNVADINILLIAMLREAGLSAEPVILSLRSNGYTHEVYPLIDRYNYVICCVITDGKHYYLDASEVHNTFGRLPAACYNGQARIITEDPKPVYFSADSLKEIGATAVFVANDGKGKISGKVIQKPGYVESQEIRKKVLKEGETAFINQFRKELDEGIQVQDVRIDSLKLYESPLQVILDFESNQFNEAVVYWDPLIGQGVKQNPFKSMNRQYPVELPHTVDQSFQLEMDVPEGYLVDELPKPLQVKLNEKGDGTFEYSASMTAGHIKLYSRLKINRSFFSIEEYQMLREFFNLVVKKHAEQIVFKKKS